MGQHNDDDAQLHQDHLFAWSCGLNARLYDNDPGPREMVVGGPGEQRVIDRRERLLDSYARMVLVELDGDLDRLAAVVGEAQRKHQDKSERGFEADKVEAELIAVELAERAAQIIRDAGAADDPQARESAYADGDLGRPLRARRFYAGSGQRQG